LQRQQLTSSISPHLSLAVPHLNIACLSPMLSISI